MCFYTKELFYAKKARIMRPQSKSTNKSGQNAQRKQRLGYLCEINWTKASQTQKKVIPL